MHFLKKIIAGQDTINIRLQMIKQ